MVRFRAGMKLIPVTLTQNDLLNIASHEIDYQRAWESTTDPYMFLPSEEDERDLGAKGKPI
jgi:hypothetical protein